jgi:hypothetical protein
MQFNIESKSTLIAGVVCYRSKPPSTENYAALLDPSLQLSIFGTPSGVRKAMVIGPRIDSTENEKFDPNVALELVLSRKRRPEMVVVWSESIISPSNFDWVIGLDRYGKLRFAGSALTVFTIENWTKAFRFLVRSIGVTSGFMDCLPASTTRQRFGIGDATSNKSEFNRFQRSVHFEIANDVKKIPPDQILWDVGELNFLNEKLLGLDIAGVSLRRWIELKPAHRGLLSPIEGCNTILWRINAAQVPKTRRELGEFIVCYEETIATWVKSWTHRHFGY